MPVRGPSLVHDLSGKDRIEVERLLADGEKDIPLPALEIRRVVRDEPEQVALRMNRNRRLLAHLTHSARRDRIERGKPLAKLIVDERLGLDVFRIPGTPQRQINVD